MVTIIITIILTILISIWLNYDKYFFDFIDIIANVIVETLIGFIIGLTIALALPMKTYDKYSFLDIETLQDNSSVSGNFFLGCGQIEGKMKYVLYYEEKGLYSMMQLDYDKVQIKYSNSKPKVNIIQNYPTDAFINNFAIDLDVFDKRYIIEVPKGTIKNNYNLDAQ